MLKRITALKKKLVPRRKRPKKVVEHGKRPQAPPKAPVYGIR